MSKKLPERAGPPTPRSPIPAEQRAIYAKRDTAWAAYYETHVRPHQYNGVMVAVIRDTFNAGWKARKAAQYQTVMEALGLHDE